MLEIVPNIYMDIDTRPHNKGLYLARKYKFCNVNDTENENQHAQFKRFHSKESLASFHVYRVYPSRDRYICNCESSCGEAHLQTSLEDIIEKNDIY